jgi:hypothetical protein
MPGRKKQCWMAGEAPQVLKAEGVARPTCIHGVAEGWVSPRGRRTPRTPREPASQCRRRPAPVVSS